MSERTNRYHYDLKNVHYAKGTKQEDGTITYGVPKRMPGAMSMDISAEGDTTPIRADGTNYLVLVSNNGYSGSITMVEIKDDFKQDCLGEQVDTANKIQYEDANAEPSPFALLFEFVGDVKNKRHVLYNCTASRPSLVGENKDSQKEPDTEEIELTASPATMTLGNEEKSIVKANTVEETDPEVYRAWYTQVITPGQSVVKTAKLSSLTIGSLSLEPEFTPAVLGYTAQTANATNSIRAAAADANAVIEIKNGEAVISNGAAATWSDGENTVTIKVTNGDISETYTVTVTKGV